ncbi:MAG: hypothetical protein RIQ75_1312 [Pseudomonadota bacterium]
MKKPSATAKNAVKHGVFAAQSGQTAPSAFAQLATVVLGDQFGPEAADDLARAEGQNRRSHAAALHQAMSVEACLANIQVFSDSGPHQLNEELCKLNRLLRYYSDSLNTLRKRRIEVLNAAEGIQLSRRAREK